MINRVLLLLPSVPGGYLGERRRVPANLLSLAGELSRINDLEVRVLDAESLAWSAADVANYAAEWGANLVGVSVCSPAYVSAIQAVAAVRSALPDSVIVLGGKHVTHCWEEVAHQCTAADVLVIGEGELALSAMARAMLKADDARAAVLEARGIANAWTRPSTDQLTLPPPYDLNCAPLKPYSCLVPSLDAYLGNCMLIEFSRGCPGLCTYCLAARYRRGMSWRAPKSVLEELLLLNERGFTKFFFTDDDLAASPKHLEALCRSILDSQLHIEFDANVRPDSLVRCEAIAEMIFAAGCRCLWLGIESGNEQILQGYNKGFGTTTCEEAVSIAHRAARLVKTNWLVGAPEESEASIRDSINLAKRLRKIGPHLPHISFLVPYPGSPLLEQVLSARLITRDELDAQVWITHSHPFFPSRYLSVADLVRLYREFHLELYSSEFLGQVTQAVREEAATVLKHL